VRVLFQELQRRMRPSRPRPVILIYHRVADPPVDPWGLAVRPAHFDEHLAVIRRSRRPLHMSGFFKRLERGELPADAVAVTFDDGYVDNLRQARPRLASARVPATLFVTTGAVGQRAEYWWDELARSILLRRAPLNGEVDIAGEPVRLVFGAADDTGQASAWRAWQDPETERQATYLAIWGRLRTASAAARDAAMNRLRELLEPPPPDSADLPMTEAEIAVLAADDLFEIGGHTVTHPVLPALEPAERRREIREGRLACERLVNKPIAGFAYPHGALDADSQAAVRECGFLWACSTQSRAVPSHGYDRYALPRVGVLDGDAHAFERALQEIAG